MRKYTVTSGYGDKSGNVGLCKIFDLNKLSSIVSKSMNKFFYKLGFKVAEYPMITICLTILTSILCFYGYLQMKTLGSFFKLWIPHDSDFLENSELVMKKVETGIRNPKLIITSKTDVLTPKVMEIILKLDGEIKNLTMINDKGELKKFDDFCFVVPYLTDLIPTMKDFQNSSSSLSKIEPKFEMDRETMCAIYENLDRNCMRSSILEMWKFNETQIKNLTKLEILQKLNNLKFSPVTGHPAEFVSKLGGVKRDKSGKVSSALTLITYWPFSAAFKLDLNDDNIEGDAIIEKHLIELESKVSKLFAKYKEIFDDDDLKIFHATDNSFLESALQTVQENVILVVFSVSLMVFYMIIVLSKYSWVEFRILLSFCGIVNVALAYFTGCGIMSWMFSFSQMHKSLFFILTGLGVDDIFVIISCLRKLSESEEFQKLPLPERIGKVLEKAGTSITITSLTDVIAFSVGSITSLPNLKSFCMFAACCILINYLYVVTFFVACLTIDEKRVKNQRNGIFPCITHKTSEICCDPKIMSKFIKFLYSNFVLKIYGKIFIILVTIGMSAFSYDRIFKIERNFVVEKFIPEHLQLHEYLTTYNKFYEHKKIHAGVYFTDLNFIKNFPKMFELRDRIKALANVEVGELWADNFNEFLHKKHQIDLRNSSQTLNETAFSTLLSDFLFTESGFMFQKNFKFEKPVKCVQRAVSKIEITWIDITFYGFDKTNEHRTNRDKILKIIKQIDFNVDNGGKVFLWGPCIGHWTVDDRIATETYRNLVMVLISVFCCSLVMIVNLQVCLLILVVVVMCLLTVGCCMQLTDLSLDVVTCISLQLAVGLCVDFASHIGHTFLTISEGDGNAKAQKTVETIGDAVWQGGISTILAVLPLAFTDVYGLKIFSIIFGFVACSGIFYGTFFLPVILSILNPKSHED